MSIKSRAVSGIKWSSASQFGRQAAQLITTAIIARLLKPADFGLIGMATVVIGFIALFKDLGTSSALIQRKDVSEDLCSSIYWINATFGLLAMAVLYFLSPLIADFYNEQRIEPVLQLLSVTFFISGLSILHQALLEKELAFEKLAKLEIIATVSGSVVGIVAALMGYGVWSLVFQTVAVTIVTTLLLWLTSGWRPKILFNFGEIRNVCSYSLNLTGFSIFNFFVRNADYLLIGKYLGAQDLGYYTLAYRIMLYPLQSVSAVIARVMFPVYSLIQADNSRFRDAYLKVATAIALVTFPMMFGLWVVADSFVVTVFGNQWEPVILLIKILIPVGMVQSIGTTVGAIYQAKGRTDLMFRWGVVLGVFTVISFVVGLKWGIVGVASAYAIITFVLIYPAFAIPFSIIEMPMKQILKTLSRPIICSIVMAMFLVAIKGPIYNMISNQYALSILIMIGILLYLFTSMMINHNQITQTLKIIKSKKHEYYTRGIRR